MRAGLHEQACEMPRIACRPPVFELDGAVSPREQYDTCSTCL